MGPKQPETAAKGLAGGINCYLLNVTLFAARFAYAERVNLSDNFSVLSLIKFHEELGG